MLVPSNYNHSSVYKWIIIRYINRKSNTHSNTYISNVYTHRIYWKARLARQGTAPDTGGARCLGSVIAQTKNDTVYLSIYFENPRKILPQHEVCSENHWWMKPPNPNCSSITKYKTSDSQPMANTAVNESAPVERKRELKSKWKPSLDRKKQNHKHWNEIA